MGLLDLLHKNKGKEEILSILECVPMDYLIHIDVMHLNELVNMFLLMSTYFIV